jgi:hydrogenase maturation protein HypF
MNIHRMDERKRLHIEVTGVVQGVGFRPFVYNLARSNGLKGFVMNSSGGVVIEVEGGDADSFAGQLLRKPPPLAEIITVRQEEIPFHGDHDFHILPSLDRGESTPISPDVSICPDCFSEMLNPDDRRYLYPFINCTNCGPRYSITLSVPYDRPNTTMGPFSMCEECLEEYHDPSDRRFHAQPNACSHCGPSLEFLEKDERLRGRDALSAAIKTLNQGKIVAVRGLGGFHLAAHAGKREAVERLRLRKRKSNKPFALMAPTMEQVRQFCNVSQDEEELLLSRERPIVLLKRRASVIPSDPVAPGVPDLGFMLPYTPLHSLLFFQSEDGNGTTEANFPALVMTSGNLSEEPIVTENDSAIKKLSSIADAFLLHDRAIFMPVDDSVVRAHHGKVHFIRRARGYVPSLIKLEHPGPEVLACGGDLKNTFTLCKGDTAIVSQHMGDMENVETIAFFEKTLENLQQVYRVSPEALAFDLHPGYHSTQWAHAQSDIQKLGVQHHYAHIASVMAEHGLRDPVIGIALDGSGYGTDGSVWGGEFLIADLNGFERRAHFSAVPLPGAESAIKHPWFMAVSYVREALGSHCREYFDRLGLTERVGSSNIDNVLKIMENRSLSPLTSSAGRLFDALSSLLGLRDHNTYEGEAAMALESCSAPGIEERYTYTINEGNPSAIYFSETIRGVLKDLEEQTDPRIIAAKFHNTVAGAVVEMALRIHKESGIGVAALSGGVFQNLILLQKVTEALRCSGLVPHTNVRVPCNDGGISLGQAYLLRERLKRADRE